MRFSEAIDEIPPAAVGVVVDPHEWPFGLAARDLGFSRRGFSAEVSRLRLEGVELAYREGVD